MLQPTHPLLLAVGGRGLLSCVAVREMKWEGTMKRLSTFYVSEILAIREVTEEVNLSWVRIRRTNRSSKIHSRRL